MIRGASARTVTYSLEEMREDLRQFADALGLDRFVLGGHSMGGTVATLFAERYPDRLAGLILVDSPPPDGTAPSILVPARTAICLTTGRWCQRSWRS